VPVSPSEQEQYFIHTTIVSPADLSSQNFDDFDAIVLANVADVAPTTAESIAAYLNRGGGLLVFPGDNTNVAYYNDQLFGRYRILPARLGEAKGEANSEKKVLALQDKNFEHPIAAIWNDPASGSPSSASFYRVLALVEAPSNATTKPTETPRVVMRYSDNSAAIVESTIGRGRSILFSSTADTAWNDLPVKPGIFVPLIYRAMGAIVQRQDEQMNLLAGQKFAYTAPTDLLGRDAMIATPTDAPGKSTESRRIELVNHEPLLTFDQTDVAGRTT
jgi:hypothetical protein